MNPPRIGITLGDPAGIGPEIVLKALSSQPLLPKASYIIFGASLVLEKAQSDLGLKLGIRPFDRGASPLPPLSFYEVKAPLKTVQQGSPSRENGEASFRFFQAAIEEAKRGTIQACVTAPISKYSWRLAGLQWQGHTDYLTQAYPEAVMAFWSENLKVALFSHHLPLESALKKVRKEALLDFFLRLQRNMERIKPAAYHFLVAGLNPHAGEEGALGSEEKEEIQPAIEEAKLNGMRISGPFPADIVFRMAFNRPDKIVIALYHDQGLIPFKLASFEKGVNVTLGLPFIRTSPDHGTAFDIAGKGMARPESMVEAIKLAYELSPGLL